ncbi:MAG: hypothetical protein R3E09_05185 [Novosphingobium sp.]
MSSDILRLGFGRGGSGHRDAERRALGRLERGLAGGFARKRDAPFAQQRLHPLAREAARFGQRLVEPLAA